MLPETEDTIAAIATPYGRSALGTVRISGPQSIAISSQIFISRSQDIVPQKPILGKILMKQREIDEAVLIFFQKPHSYTREDLVEITCHGNPLILDQVLESLITFGARLARPGEFTYRAFLNGRIDLIQATAVNDLISADSLYQAELALQHLEGGLSSRLDQIRLQFIELISLLEGNIDFSEEQHYHFIDTREAAGRIDGLVQQMQNLLGTFERGRLIRDGFRVAIAGKPNVGKSSIFNSLLGENRAIVTPVPGTTRDYLRERITLGNFVMQLIDTAGVRESLEPIETEGIRRTMQTIEKADLVLFVIDGSVETDAEDQRLWSEIQSKSTIVIANKADLPGFQPRNWHGEAAHSLSAVTGAGVEELLKRLQKEMEERVRFHSEEFLVSNLRHRNILESSLVSVQRAKEALEAGRSEEFAMVDLHEAMKRIGEITGEVTIEDIYQQIFTNFCIGK